MAAFVDQNKFEWQRFNIKITLFLALFYFDQRMRPLRNLENCSYMYILHGFFYQIARNFDKSGPFSAFRVLEFRKYFVKLYNLIIPDKLQYQKETFGSKARFCVHFEKNVILQGQYWPFVAFVLCLFILSDRHVPLCNRNSYTNAVGKQTH